MQVWEALYRHMVDVYISNHKTDFDFEDFLQVVKARLFQCNVKCVKDNNYDDYIEFAKFMERECATVYDNFFEDLAEKDDTWIFWCGFVVHDCLAYV